MSISSHPARKTGTPTTAGILSIIAGALFVISAATGPFILSELVNAFTLTPASDRIPWYIFVLLAIPIAIIGAVAILGGTVAIRRRRWGLALAGAICATVSFFPVGIPAIILLIRSRREFGI